MTHDEVIEFAVDNAKSLGVTLDVDRVDDRLIFAIDRGEAPRGSGAAAIAELVRLADGADIEVLLDVKASEVALVGYYWRFGFRIHDGTPKGEAGDLAKLTRQIERHCARGRDREDFGVTTMWRDRWAGPLDTSRPRRTETTA
jgi:hypothetical protein